MTDQIQKLSGVQQRKESEDINAVPAGSFTIYDTTVRGDPGLNAVFKPDGHISSNQVGLKLIEAHNKVARALQTEEFAIDAHTKSAAGKAVAEIFGQKDAAAPIPADVGAREIEFEGFRSALKKVGVGLRELAARHDAAAPDPVDAKYTGGTFAKKIKLPSGSGEPEPVPAGAAHVAMTPEQLRALGLK